MSIFTSAMNGLQQAAGAIKNGTANAYRKHALAGARSYGAASIMAGSLMGGGGANGIGKRAAMSWSALSNRDRSSLGGSMAGAVMGAGMGYGASGDGWGGAGAVGGAAAGFFGGARAGGIAQTLMNGRGMRNAAASKFVGPQNSMANRAKSQFTNASTSAQGYWNQASSAAQKGYAGFKGGFNKSLNGGA